jgi:hypothetical protein
MSMLTTLLALRVSAVLLAAVLVFALLELIALLAIHGRTPWIPVAWAYVTHPLTGEDGRLSFTKLFALTMVGAYGIFGKDFMPAVVACFLISASFGAKVFTTFLQTRNATTVTTEVSTPAAPPATPAVTQTTVQTVPPTVVHPTE